MEARGLLVVVLMGTAVPRIVSFQLIAVVFLVLLSFHHQALYSYGVSSCERSNDNVGHKAKNTHGSLN